MRDFNRNNRSGGGRNFGKRNFEGGQNQDREMHKAICSRCGKECEVPFRPTSGKPIFCTDCFRENGGPDSRRPERRDFRRPSFDNRNENRDNSQQPNYKDQLESLNIKLDKILKLLTPIAPVKTAAVVTAEKVVPEIKEQKPEETATLPAKKKKASKKASKTKTE